MTSVYLNRGFIYYCESENLTVKPPLVLVTGKEEETAGIVLL